VAQRRKRASWNRWPDTHRKTTKVSDMILYDSYWRQKISLMVLAFNF